MMSARRRFPRLTPRRGCVIALLACGFAVAPSQAPDPWFVESAESAGLRFKHFAGISGKHYLPEIMGAGAALFDYDQDGDLDVYLIQGSVLDAEAPRPDPAPLNRLFRNEAAGGGKLRFVDVTGASGLGHPGYGMGAAVGDYDGDGDLDLYLTNFGPNVLYRNNGDGSFTDVTADSGTGDERWSTSSAFVDYDGDGDLDLMVLNYIDFTVAGNKRCYDAAGAPDYCNPNLYRPLPDRLLRNDGEGKFADVTEAAGLAAAVGPGLGVTCADFNRDGKIDLYVANDGAPNYLWINRGDGTFEEAGLMSGSAYNADGAPEGSMGVVAGDFDADGDEDLFMTHLSQETNTLYANDGSGNFVDATSQSGLGDASRPFTGFGAVRFDFDDDGWEDLFVANGAVRNLASLRGQAYPYHQTNQLFQNRAGKFEDRSAAAGPAFELSEVSRGAAVGDVDNDGDQDLLVTNNNGSVRLLLNQAAAGRRLRLRLQAGGHNRFGAGAMVEAALNDGTVLRRRVQSDGSYLSAGELSAHFGLGAGRRVESLTVHWPDGGAERWAAGRLQPALSLSRGTGEVVSTR